MTNFQASPLDLSNLYRFLLSRRTLLILTVIFTAISVYDLASTNGWSRQAATKISGASSSLRVDLNRDPQESPVEQKLSQEPSQVPSQVPPQEPPRKTGSTPLPSPLCRALPGADDVVVVMKTGGTEAFARIPEQLLTLSHCVPNFMIFSDLEQDIGGYHIYDALEEVSDSYKENHEDFKFYRELKRTHDEHGDVTQLESEGKGWALDKWKNIPMLHKVYHTYPEAKWYIFLDADTYLSWNNLLAVVSKVDHNFPHYMGSIYFHGSTPFAQGGTGYLISREAARKFEAIHTAEYIEKWEEETSTICCGDVMLSIAMHDAGVNVSGIHPLFVSDGPAVLDWGDWLFCEPSVTWHHVKPYDVEGLWNFEQKWIKATLEGEGSPRPYFYKDLFEHYVRPHLSDVREDWDNLSHDRVFARAGEEKVDWGWDWLTEEEKTEMWEAWSEEQKATVESVENCRLLCESDRGCRQWSWKPGSCRHSWSVRLGQATHRDKQTVSGWMMQRLMGFEESGEECVSKWAPEQGI